MHPSVIDPAAIGQLEGFTHQASLISINPKSFDNNLAEIIYNYLSLEREIQFGMSSAMGNGMIVRILGHGAEQLHQQLKTIASLIQQPKITHSMKETYAE
jgi:urease accessory protein